MKKTTLALVSAVSAFALSAAYAGDVAGRVTDGTGDVPLRAARVTVVETGQTVATRRDGSFRITGLEAGQYTLEVEYPGYGTQTATITVDEDGEATIAIAMTDGDVVVVRGQRGSLNSSIAQQRASDGVVTVLSADDIGQLPDENVAEASRRALGVSIANDQGEGRFISIRGINSNLNATSVNGIRLTSPEAGDRRIGLDVIDADILQNIVISKTLSADMDGDAIGGSINLETISGLDREDRLVKLKLGTIYTDFTEDFGPKVSGTFLDNFMDGRLGVALSASFQNREFASDNGEVDGGWETDDVLPYPGDEIEFRNYDIERERLSLAANFDFMATENTKLFLRTLYNDFSDQEFRSRVEFKQEDAGLAFDGDHVQRFTGTADEFEYEVDRDIKDRLEEQRITSIATGFEHERGAWFLDGTVSFVHAEEEEPGRVDANFDQGFEDDGFLFSVNVSDPLTPVVSLTGATRDAFLDASAYEFDNIEFTDGITEDDELALAFNAKRDVMFGANPGFIKSGFKVRLRDKSYDLDFRAFDYEGDTATLAGLDTTVDYPLAEFGPAPDAALVRQFFADNAGDFEFDADGSLEDSAVSSFDAEENVYAGYIMGQVDIDNLRVTGGVRIEHTTTSATGNLFNEEDDVTGDASVSSVTVDNDYTDVLPSVAARWNATEQVIVRASYYGSIVRPNFGQFVPAGVLNDDDELEAGNPDLDRTKANNFDLLVEYYPTKSSIFQAGIFYKTLDDFIASTFSEEPGTFNGIGFEEIETFSNLQDASIFGVEIGYQQALDFLPAGLDGLIVSANYTYADSEATLIDEDGDATDITLPGQSEHIVNAILGYEKGPLNLRLAYSFKDENIDDLDVDGIGNGRVVLVQEFLDFSAKFAINENVRLYGDVKNILDTSLDVSDRIGGVDFRNQFEEYGLSAQFGVLVNF